MNCQKMIEEWLISNGYDGLYVAGECACKIGSLFPCCSVATDCKPGYINYLSCEEDGKCEHDWHISGKKPDSVPTQVHAQMEGVQP